MSRPDFRVPSWAVGPSISVLIALMAVAVSWGATTRTIEQLEEHKADTRVHTNSELVEYRLNRIEQKVDEVLRLLQESR